MKIAKTMKYAAPTVSLMVMAAFLTVTAGAECGPQAQFKKQAWHGNNTAASLGGAKYAGPDRGHVACEVHRSRQRRSPPDGTPIDNAAPSGIGNPAGPTRITETFTLA